MATTFIGSAATSYISGSADAPQSLFTIENSGSDSPVIVKIRKIIVQSAEYSATIMVFFKSYRLTELPTGGTVLDKTPFDTLSGSNSSVIVRGGAAIGGGGGGAVLTPITSSLSNGVCWQHYGTKKLTASDTGQLRFFDNNILPSFVKNTPIVLRPNEAMGVELEAFTGSLNVVGSRHFVQCVWEEESI